MAINSNIPMKLHEFNNLTKSLNFYFYDISYAGDKEDKLAYNKYINDKYNAEKLSAILKTVTEKIGASVLNLSKQNYDPVGSSVCLLITEEPVAKEIIDFTNNEGNVDLTHIEHVSHPTPIQEEDLFAHLDKSHITVHTYPEYSPITNLATFRVDINVSTCGKISPLVALNYLIDEFEIEDVTEVVCIDYLVRGFTRLTSDEKIFIDHKINNITDFIDKEYLDKYHFKNVNYKKNRIWTTKLVIKKLVPEFFIFDKTKISLNPHKLNQIFEDVKKEILSIYNCNKKKLNFFIKRSWKKSLN